MYHADLEIFVWLRRLLALAFFNFGIGCEILPSSMFNNRKIFTFGITKGLETGQLLDPLSESGEGCKLELYAAVTIQQGLSSSFVCQ